MFRSSIFHLPHFIESFLLMLYASYLRALLEWISGLNSKSATFSKIRNPDLFISMFNPTFFLLIPFRISSFLSRFKSLPFYSVLNLSSFIPFRISSFLFSRNIFQIPDHGEAYDPSLKASSEQRFCDAIRYSHNQPSSPFSQHFALVLHNPTFRVYKVLWFPSVVLD